MSEICESNLQCGKFEARKLRVALFCLLFYELQLTTLSILAKNGPFFISQVVLIPLQQIPLDHSWHVS